MTRNLCAMLAVVGVAAAACAAGLVNGVDDPPARPFWWQESTIDDVTAAGGTYGFVHSPDGTTANQQRRSNLDPFDMTVIRVGNTNEVYVVLQNEFRQNFEKTFFLLIQGETSNPANPPMGGTVVVGANDGGQTSVVNITDGPLGVTQFVPGSQNFRWTVRVEGTIRPQPDRVEMSFVIPDLVGIGRYWGGEYCVPSPGTTALLAAGSLLVAAKRRRG